MSWAQTTSVVAFSKSAMSLGRTSVPKAACRAEATAAPVGAERRVDVGRAQFAAEASQQVVLLDSGVRRAEQGDGIGAAFAEHTTQALGDLV